MKSRRLSAWMLAPLALALAALACGPTSTTPPTATSEPAATTPPETSGAVDNLQDVKSAVIQIEAQGTFVDPQVGTVYNAAGRGSGFIIDPSGLAVTNNHVVTGAALIKVWVGGESTARNARILGVSECSDLAVIDIDGDGYPYLEFFGGNIDVGLEVYAAGFPLGDPEYTLTKGIVSKARADGRTSWASVESVIEHDATINPGNSGGPLVTADGQLVGINYAGNSGTNQYFAIKGQDAQGVIDQLSDGRDVDSIGINGQAILSDDGSIAGLWVSSVKSGSPAGNAGVQGGDIITTLEGLVLATDGTMADYCDILRSHSPSDVMALEVLRFSSEEFLAGELNGQPLSTRFSFSNSLGNEVGNTGGATTYSDYMRLTDDNGAIEMEVPAEWSDYRGANWTDADGNVIGAALSASPNLDEFLGGWEVPGVFFGVSDEVARWGGYIQLLDFYREDFSSVCTYEGRVEYGDNDPIFEGAYDLFTNCGDSSNVFVVLSARPKTDPTAYLVLVQIQIITDADLEALDRIFATFNVIGALP